MLCLNWKILPAPVYLLVFFISIENINTLEKMFHRLSNISKFVKNTPLCAVFSTVFSMFEYPDETLFLVFDILLHIVLGSCSTSQPFQADS